MRILHLKKPAYCCGTSFHTQDSAWCLVRSVDATTLVSISTQFDINNVDVRCLENCFLLTTIQGTRRNPHETKHLGVRSDVTTDRGVSCLKIRQIVPAALPLTKDFTSSPPQSRLYILLRYVAGWSLNTH